MFKKVLIANRGEIAVRVIRTCRDMGIQTVLVYSEADRNSLAVSMADEAICIGPPQSSASYLNMKAILVAAAATRAEAVHPGYGFLAENPAFSQACEEHGIKFIGPPRHIIELMGDKRAARRVAAEAGVPVLPGSHEPIGDLQEAAAIAADIGYPLLLKAAAGGGGRGMRRVDSPDQLADAIMLASSEAKAAFGDGSLYMERFIPNARHVEVQVMMDRFGNAIHLGDRDCTIQRRYQKLVEEAPSTFVSPEVRTAMGEAAVALIRHTGYEGAGTVEFLFDQDSGRFYFIEMNTRLQVEHPVTEAVTGMDLVALQLRVAAGERLPLAQEDVRFHGHAIEFRVNAENPANDFLPCAGRLEAWAMPQGPGVRVDTHCYPGYIVPPYYDSLMAKVIVHGADRDEALRRSRRALREAAIAGVDTLLPFHRELLEDPDFISGRTNTRWVEERMQRKESNSHRG